jgi:hypothetical protein
MWSIRYARASSKLFCVQTITRNYWTHGKFRIKCLNATDVQQQLERRNIDISTMAPYMQRKKLEEIIQSELASNTLTNESAVELMTFWDIQENLSKFKLPSSGSGEVLRVRLLEALQAEEQKQKVIFQISFNNLKRIVFVSNFLLKTLG